MAKEPADRYLSAGDFARDAAAALRGVRSSAPPTIVGVGEAKPSLDPDEDEAQPAAERQPAPPTIAGTPTEEPEPQSEIIQPTGPATRLSDPAPPLAPVAAAAAATSPPRDAPPPPPPPTPPTPSPAAGGGGDAPGGAGGGSSLSRYRVPATVGLVLAAVAVVAVIVLSSGGGGSSTPKGQQFESALDPVPTNRVTGGGTGSVRLNGDVATVAVDVTGLLNGSPHAMHIHAGGKGECPPASAARPHNGNLAISTSNGIAFYGPPQVALTSTGDTSPKSIIDFPRFPATGTIAYKRTITVPAGVAAAIRANNAVVVVHGIDYNNNGIYDNVLDRSELRKSLPGEATAPALCGHLVATKTATAGTGQTYAVVLHRYVAAAPTPADRFLLLCGLLGITTS